MDDANANAGTGTNANANAAAPRKPDALRYPMKWKPQGRTREDYCRAVLGAPGHFRVSDPVFVTADPYDTILYPTGHEREKFPRYDWVTQADGCEYGYLKAEDKPHA